MPYAEAIVLHKVLTELHIGMLFLAFLAGMTAAFGFRKPRWQSLTRTCDATFILGAICGTVFLLVSAATGLLAWPWDRLWRMPMVYSKVSFSALAFTFWTILIVQRLRYGSSVWEQRAGAVPMTTCASLGLIAVLMAGSAGGHLGHGVSLLDPLFAGFDPYIPIVWAPWLSVGIIVSGSYFLFYQALGKDKKPMPRIAYGIMFFLFAGAAGVTKIVWSDPGDAGRIAQAQPQKDPPHAPSTHGHDMGSRPHTGHEHQDHKMEAPRTSKLKPAEGASVKILTPKAGQIFNGDQVPVHFRFVKGKRGDHIHAYVDGELMGMFQSEKGTLTGIKPGKHVLEVRVVADDHQTELEARDQVHFMVR